MINFSCTTFVFLGVNNCLLFLCAWFSTNILLIKSQALYPLSVHASDRYVLSSPSWGSLFWNLLNLSNLYSTQLSSWNRHLADSLSFIPILDLLFPVSPVPFLTWLSHLFENIFQEFLEKGCVGGKFFETLHLKMCLFYPHTWLRVWLGREIFQAGNDCRAEWRGLLHCWLDSSVAL